MGGKDSQTRYSGLIALHAANNPGLQVLNFSQNDKGQTTRRIDKTQSAGDITKSRRRSFEKNLQRKNTRCIPRCYCIMEGALALSTRASKRGKLSQSHDHSNVQDMAVEPSLQTSRVPPTSRVTRNGQMPHTFAARGASPTRINPNTIFSHATLPNFQNFGDLTVAPGESQAHLSEPPLADFSSDAAFSFSNAFNTDDYIWDEENLIPSVENICNATECTAKSCPSCMSCEQSCYLPCENPDECSSEVCRNYSCVCSPQPTCTGHHTPIYDQCEWVGNGENCAATVHSPGQTVQHVTENHIKPQTQITCEWDSCGISTDVHRLPNHLWSDHEPASYVCLWYNCEQAFSTQEELDAHFKMVHCHMGCHWAGCEMITTSQTELQNHFNQNHLRFDLGHEHYPLASQVTPPMIHQRSSATESNTSMILQASPGESRTENVSSTTSEEDCSKSEMAGKSACMWITGEDRSTQCGMIFENGNTLQEHIRSTHILPLKSTALTCGWFGCDYIQSTKDKSKLARHAYKHSKYCFGACKYCHQEFSEQSKLRQHEATHLDKKAFHCKSCDRRFPTQNALTNHERIHKGEKPLVCGMIVGGEKCAYTCSDPSNMSTHKKKHLPPKFACCVCEKAFCRSDTLKRHMIVHDPKRMAAKKRGFNELVDVATDYFRGM